MTKHKMPKKPKMRKPKSGGKPKQITTKGTPGGPHTPGAKGTYPKRSSRGK